LMWEDKGSSEEGRRRREWKTREGFASTH